MSIESHNRLNDQNKSKNPAEGPSDPLRALQKDSGIFAPKTISSAGNPPVDLACLGFFGGLIQAPAKRGAFPRDPATVGPAQYNPVESSTTSHRHTVGKPKEAPSSVPAVKPDRSKVINNADGTKKYEKVVDKATGMSEERWYSGDGAGSKRIKDANGTEIYRKAVSKAKGTSEERWFGGDSDGSVKIVSAAGTYEKRVSKATAEQGWGEQLRDKEGNTTTAWHKPDGSIVRYFNDGVPKTIGAGDKEATTRPQIAKSTVPNPSEAPQAKAAHADVAQVPPPQAHPPHTDVATERQIQTPPIPPPFERERVAQVPEAVPAEARSPIPALPPPPVGAEPPIPVLPARPVEAAPPIAVLPPHPVEAGPSIAVVPSVQPEVVQPVARPPGTTRSLATPSEAVPTVARPPISIPSETEPSKALAADVKAVPKAAEAKGAKPQETLLAHAKPRDIAQPGKDSGRAPVRPVIDLNRALSTYGSSLTGTERTGFIKAVNGLNEGKFPYTGMGADGGLAFKNLLEASGLVRVSTRLPDDTKIGTTEIFLTPRNSNDGIRISTTPKHRGNKVTHQVIVDAVTTMSSVGPYPLFGAGIYQQYDLNQRAASTSNKNPATVQQRLSNILSLIRGSR